MLFGRDGHNDELHGGDGDGQLLGTTGSVLYGDAGNDLLELGQNDEYGDFNPFVGEIYGGDGDDVLRGSGLLDGRDGNDTVIGAANAAGATTLTGGAGVDTFAVGYAFRPDAPSNTLDYGYEAVTIADFDPASEVLQVTVATDTVDQTVLSTETHGDDLWVVLTDTSGQEFVAAVIEGVSADSIGDESIILQAQITY